MKGIKGTYSLRTFYLLDKFINNQYSANERDELLKILKNNENNKQIRLVTKTLWHVIENTSDSFDFQKSEDVLRNEARKILRCESAKSCCTKSNKQKRSHINSAIGMVAAAVVLVLVLEIPVLKNDLESVETNLVNCLKFTYIDKNN